MLHTAAGLTVNHGQYEVTVEHCLLACLDTPRSDVSVVLTTCGCEVARLRQELNAALETFRSGNSGRPVFSPLLQELLEAAWLVASVDMGQTRIRSGALLLAFLRRPSFYAQGGYASALACVNRESLQQRFAEWTKDSDESAALAQERTDNVPGVREAGGEGFIARFCEDFSAKARAGKLDPVFGRDAEIRQMVDILARRRKNNPILVGEPGVGKTAVMEGLALRIVEGDVPETLRGVTLLGLDMGLLEAGASVKGEFERRLKGVLDEIKSSANPIMLFIDEAHLLVGAGGSAGGSDAANLM
ncbi:MAG: AAA family ATPase, partial [Bilophila sp.]